MNKQVYSNKVLITVGIFIIVVALIILFVKAIQVILLIFAGVLTAVFLRGTAAIIANHIHISERFSIFLVILLFLVLAGLGVWVLGPNIIDGFNELKDKVPTAWNHLKEELSQYVWGKTIVESINKNIGDITSNREIINRLTGIFSSTLAGIVNIFIILVIGLYTAFTPDLYLRGFIKLFPKTKRDRIDEVLEAMGVALRWWFVGRVASMIIIGILTSIGLWMLNIPMPVVLGIFAAILTFVPNIGPVVSAVPSVLFGLVQSPLKGVYVVALHLVIQFLESYLITPQIQKKAVSIAPALLISMQILFGILLGIFGLILATPLMVCVIVAVQMLYIEDTLGDNVRILGDSHSNVH